MTHPFLRFKRASFGDYNKTATLIKKASRYVLCGGACSQANMHRLRHSQPRYKIPVVRKAKASLYAEFFPVRCRGCQKRRCGVLTNLFSFRRVFLRLCLCGYRPWCFACKGSVAVAGYSSGLEGVD